MKNNKASSMRKMYRDLEMKVLSELRNLIMDSPIVSDFNDSQVIKVNSPDYIEMAIVCDEHTLLDSNGYQYRALAVCSLEDLIDILYHAYKESSD